MLLNKFRQILGPCAFGAPVPFALASPGSLGILDETNRVGVTSLIVVVRIHRRARIEVTVEGTRR